LNRMSNITGTCAATKQMQLCLNKNGVPVPNAGIRWCNDTALPSDYNMRIPDSFVFQYYFNIISILFLKSKTRKNCPCSCRKLSLFMSEIVPVHVGDCPCSCRRLSLFMSEIVPVHVGDCPCSCQILSLFMSEED